MPMFAYQARTESGRRMTGRVEADAADAARGVLEQMQLKVEELTRLAPDRSGGTRIGRAEFLLFNRQLAAVAEAGIPLPTGLRQVAREVRKRSLKETIEAIATELEDGAEPGEAFARHGKHFPPLYGRIVQAGVRTGRLGEMLTSLSRHVDFASQTRRMLVEALTYPIIVLLFAGAVLSLVFYLVSPYLLTEQMDLLYYHQSEDLTALRAIASTGLATFWGAVGVLAVAVVALALAAWRSEGGRRLMERLLLVAPGIGAVWRRGKIAQFADALAVLVAAGTELPSALRLAAAGCSALVRCDAERLAEAVERGADPADLHGDLGVLQPMLLLSLGIGQSRRDLDDQLYLLSETYLRQGQAGQSRLKALLMPITLILLGIVVALAFGALFAPVLQTIDSVSYG
mgnify:FL=1